MHGATIKINKMWLNEESNAHKKQTERVTHIVKKLTLILYSLL